MVTPHAIAGFIFYTDLASKISNLYSI